MDPGTTKRPEPINNKFIAADFVIEDTQAAKLRPDRTATYKFRGEFLKYFFCVLIHAQPTADSHNFYKSFNAIWIQ
jgi:hypothetical protein